MSKYDIFDFRLGKRKSTGKKVVEMHIILPLHPEDLDRTYFLGFLTKENIDEIVKLYDKL